MSAALRQVGTYRAGRPALVVLISDGLDEPGVLLDAVARLRHGRSDVVMLQVLSPDELRLEHGARGRLRLRDAESGVRATVRLPAGAMAYDRRMAAHVATIREGCLARGAEHQVVRTDRSAVEALRRYLVRRRVGR